MKRWVPLTGVVFVVLLVVSFIVGGDTPNGDESAQKVVAYYTDNDTQQIVAALLGAYAALFFLFFLGTLRMALRREEGAEGGLSAVAFGGGLIFAVGGLTFSVLTFTLGDLSDKLDPSALQALNALNEDAFLPLAVGGATFLIASGISILGGAALPRWMGWVAIVIGVVAVTPAGFFAFLALLLWVLVASILLAIRTEDAAAPPAVPPA